MVFPNFEDKNKKIISNNLVYGYLEKTNSLKSKLITKKHLSIKQNIFKLSKFDCTVFIIIIRFVNVISGIQTHFLNI